MSDSRSELMAINTRYLKQAGWREIAPGHWLPKGVRINRKRPGRAPSYSLGMAINRQMEVELEASMEAEFGRRPFVHIA